MGTGSFSGLRGPWDFDGHPAQSGAEVVNGLRLHFLIVLA